MVVEADRIPWSNFIIVIPPSHSVKAAADSRLRRGGLSGGVPASDNHGHRGGIGTKPGDWPFLVSLRRVRACSKQGIT
jgi:hypothetical protein